MKYRKKFVTICCCLIAALFVIRAGEYLVDHIIGNKDGKITNPFLSSGLFIIYGLIFISLIILVSLPAIKFLSSKYALVAKKLPAPFVSFIGILFLIIVAISMNVFLFIRNPNFGADVSSYYFPVHNFMEGKGYISQGRIGLLPPGYGMLCYLFFLVTKNIEIAAMLMSSFSYVLSVVVAYYVGTMIAGRLSGFLSAFFITFCPIMVSFSFVSVISMSYMFLAFLGFLAYINVLLQKPAYFRSILLGLLLGYTFLTREEIIVAIAGGIFFLFILAIIMLKKEKSLRFRVICKHLSYPALTLVATTMFIFLQAYFVYLNTGSWVISGRLYIALSVQKIEGLTYNPNESEVKYYGEEGEPQGHLAKSLEEWSKKHSVNMFEFKLPISLTQLISNAMLAYKRLIHIMIHALFPLIFMICFVLLYVFFSLLTKKTFPCNWRITAKHTKILCAFLIFILPIGVPMAFNQANLRIIMQHSVVFFVLIALMIVKLLRLISKKFVLGGIVIVCTISFLMVLGIFKESIVVKNRFLSAGFMLTKESLHNLMNEGVSEKIVERLKPVKWTKFARTKELQKAVEQQIGEAQTEKYWGQILKHALISPLASYRTLPDVLKERSPNLGLRAAGIWLGQHYTGNIEHIKIMARRGNVVLFYAIGKNKEPKGTIVGFREDLNLSQITEKMRNENIKYLFLDRVYVKKFKNYLPLWENPDLARELGLKLLHKDPDGLFQVYSVEQ